MLASSAILNPPTEISRCPYYHPSLARIYSSSIELIVRDSRYVKVVKKTSNE